MVRGLVLLMFVFSVVRISAAEKQQAYVCYFDAAGDTIACETLMLEAEDLCADGQPNPVVKAFKKKQRLNKRITAAVLAFPFPFGIVGLHRIYLGTKPYVPVAYVASLGGVFGILPFIDFCAITFDGKNFENYRDNGQVFMWLNH